MNPVSLRGKLVLNLRVEQGCVASVSIVSTRPLAAGLLKGKTPAQAVHLAPLIFSLCGGAQGVAAQAALMAAQGGVPDELQLANWAGAIRREASSEHLWRLMLDWPQISGVERLEQAYAGCRRLCLAARDDREHAAVLKATLHDHVLGMPAASWLAQGPLAFAAWRKNSSSLGATLLRSTDGAAGGSEAATAFLPATTARDWAGMGAEIGAPEFCRAPVWHGKPHEVGALARQRAHPLVAPSLANGRRIEARITARLVELAQWASGEFGQARDWIDVAPCGPHTGLVRVETARGVLLHRVRVEHDAIADYAVVAPTEWNFHPRGVFATDAACISGNEADIVRQAQGLALSLDPCVEFEAVLGC